MYSSILKILFRAFLLSIIIYITYMILTPLKIELLPYVMIFLISFIFVAIIELFLYIVKKYVI